MTAFSEASETALGVEAKDAIDYTYGKSLAVCKQHRSFIKNDIPRKTRTSTYIYSLFDGKDNNSEERVKNSLFCLISHKYTKTCPLEIIC